MFSNNDERAVRELGPFPQFFRRVFFWIAKKDPTRHASKATRKTASDALIKSNKLSAKPTTTYTMKIVLLITALSAAFAYNEPSFPRQYDDTVLVDLDNNSCNRGERAGRRAVQNVFDNDCANAFNLDRSLSRINRNFRDSNRSNFNERTFNR